MGIIGSQFLDVIEHVDEDNKNLVVKYERYGDEIKEGSKVIVREGQAAVFIKGGVAADILSPGTYRLSTDNLPILSTLKAFPSKFNSPIKADLYFVNTRQFTNNKWGTRNPVIKQDPTIGMVRLRAFGQFAFRVENPLLFAREIMAAQHLLTTDDVTSYLSGIMSEKFAQSLGESELSVLEYASSYQSIGQEICDTVNEVSRTFGVCMTRVVVENISVPEEVEKLVDEQSGIGLARQDIKTFLEYQNARALRDAAKQEGGLAGLGAGVALGGVITDQVVSTSKDNDASAEKDPVQAVRDLKELLDEDIITQEEFDKKKKELLNL